MGRIESSDQIFPFQCDNQECNREYDLERFSNVASLWGLIFLSNSGNAFIGITCPDCFQTTVRKYPLQNAYALMSRIEHEGIQTADSPKSRVSLKHFVPFSVKILSNLSLVENKALQSDNVDGANNHLRIPFGFEPIRSYPELISSEFPYSINENLINTLVEIENTEKYKTLPRIVPIQSIYRITDEFLIGLNQSDKVTKGILQDINETLVNLIMPVFRVEIDSADQNHAQNYEHMTLNDLTPDEIKNMDLSLMAWERKDFQEGIWEFIREYKIIRNQIDFEIIYRKEFLNKWARRFYLDPGYVKQIELDAEDLLASYEEDFGISDTNLADAGPYDGNQHIKKSKDPDICGFTKRLPVDDKIKKDGSKTQNKKVSDHSLSEMIELDLPKLTEIDNAFIRKGAIWYIKFRGKSTTIKHSKKILYLVHLLINPHKHINNLDLLSQAAEKELHIREDKKYLINQNDDHSNSESEGHILNEISMQDIFKTDDHVTLDQIKTVKQEFKQMLEELKEYEKDKNHSKVEEQKLRIKGFISYADEELGIRIKLKKNYEYALKAFYKLEKEAEKARVAVRNNFSNLLKELSKKLPALERHLLRCIETKTTYAVYNPQRSRIDKSIKWYIQ